MSLFNLLEGFPRCCSEIAQESWREYYEKVEEVRTELLLDTLFKPIREGNKKVPICDRNIVIELYPGVLYHCFCSFGNMIVVAILSTNAVIILGPMTLVWECDSRIDYFLELLQIFVGYAAEFLICLVLVFGHVVVSSILLTFMIIIVGPVILVLEYWNWRALQQDETTNHNNNDIVALLRWTMEQFFLFLGVKVVFMMNAKGSAMLIVLLCSTIMLSLLLLLLWQYLDHYYHIVTKSWSFVTNSGIIYPNSGATELILEDLKKKKKKKEKAWVPQSGVSKTHFVAQSGPVAVDDEDDNDKIVQKKFSFMDHWMTGELDQYSDEYFPDDYNDDNNNHHHYPGVPPLLQEQEKMPYSTASNHHHQDNDKGRSGKSDPISFLYQIWEEVDQNIHNKSKVARISEVQTLERAMDYNYGTSDDDHLPRVEENQPSQKRTAQDENHSDSRKPPPKKSPKTVGGEKKNDSHCPSQARPISTRRRKANDPTSLDQKTNNSTNRRNYKCHKCGKLKRNHKVAGICDDLDLDKQGATNTGKLKDTKKRKKGSLPNAMTESNKSTNKVNRPKHYKCKDCGDLKKNHKVPGICDKKYGMTGKFCSPVKKVENIDNYNNIDNQSWQNKTGSKHNNNNAQSMTTSQNGGELHRRSEECGKDEMHAPLSKNETTARQQQQQQQHYTWTQTDEEVEVVVPIIKENNNNNNNNIVSSSIKEDTHVKFASKSLTVSFQEKRMVSLDLFETVDTDGCTWTIDKHNHHGDSTVSLIISMEKVRPLCWPTIET